MERLRIYDTFPLMDYLSKSYALELELETLVRRHLR